MGGGEKLFLNSLLPSLADSVELSRSYLLARSGRHSSTSSIICVKEGFCLNQGPNESSDHNFNPYWWLLCKMQYFCHWFKRILLACGDEV